MAGKLSKNISEVKKKFQKNTSRNITAKTKNKQTKTTTEIRNKEEILCFPKESVWRKWTGAEKGRSLSITCPLSNWRVQDLGRNIYMISGKCQNWNKIWVTLTQGTILRLPKISLWLNANDGTAVKNIIPNTCLWPLLRNGTNNDNIVHVNCINPKKT